jgi:hypothetical protein
VLGIAISAARSFTETEYIDMVIDKIQDLESGLFKILGTNPESVQFVEFDLRHGKRYDSVHQLVHSFSTFVENAELIESRICMNLSYTLVIKGNFPIFFFLESKIKKMIFL